MDHKYLSTSELAKALHTDRRKVGWLRKYGLIVGMRASKGYVFRDDEIDRFWETYRGFDLSNEQKIRIARQIKKGA